MDFPVHPFWDFALRVYRTPGVSEACLQVQERLGVDVNFLLFCLWLGESGNGALPRAKILHARDAVADWHEMVVKQLRSVRRTLKERIGTAPAALAKELRAQIQGREIDAEHIEQLMLVDSVGPLSPDATRSMVKRCGDGTTNIATYFSTLNIVVGAPEKAALGHIVQAAFPNLPAADLENEMAASLPQ
jgi:uncharacterized protein (TIGR02444 family)